MQSYFDTPPLVRFLQYIDWVDDDDLFDAFAREIMETGGSYIDPDAPTTTATHLFEIDLHGVTGTGASEQEVIRNWIIAALASCGSALGALPFPTPKSHAEEIENARAIHNHNCADGRGQ